MANSKRRLATVSVPKSTLSASIPAFLITGLHFAWLTLGAARPANLARFALGADKSVDFLYAQKWPRLQWLVRKHNFFLAQKMLGFFFIDFCRRQESTPSTMAGPLPQYSSNSSAGARTQQGEL